MEILLTITWTFFFILLIRKMGFFVHPTLRIRDVTWVFLLKILAGLSMYFIYTRFYTDRHDADIFKYFDDSAILYNSLFTDPGDFLRMLTGYDAQSPDLKPYYDRMIAWYNKGNLYNDNRTMIRLNALFRFFSFGYYPVHMVMMCFISLTGLVAMFKVFATEIKNKHREIFLVIFLMPSVLFWGSGVLKDGLLIFALGMLIYFFRKFSLGRTASLLPLLLSAALLVITRFYILAAVLPGLAAWYTGEKTGRKNLGLKFTVSYLLAALIIFNSGPLLGERPFTEAICYKQKEFLELAHAEQAKSQIPHPRIGPHALSFILNAPHAIANVLLRPYPAESKNPMMLMAGTENAIIIFILLLAFCSFRFSNTRSLPIFWLSLFFSLILFTLIGFTTPVMGAIVRYKASVLPFFLLLPVILYDRELLLQRFPFLKIFPWLRLS